MSLKRVTMVGGRGYVGSAMQNSLRRLSVEVVAPRSNLYDANIQTDIEKLINETRPDVIINCAGHTGKPNVDACENERAECVQGNVILPSNLRNACKKHGVIFAQISSGCIFTGRKPDGKGFSETDAPNFSFRQNNCSFYSGTKALGEEALGYREVQTETGEDRWINPDPDCYIWRLRIPFAAIKSPRNYLTKMMTYDTLLEAENSLSCLRDFSLACWQTILKDAPLGLYNVTNKGAITTTEVTELIQEVGKKLQKKTGSTPFPTKFKFFDSEAQFLSNPSIAPRSNCVLDTTKIESLGIEMPSVRNAIREALLNWKADEGRNTIETTTSAAALL